MHGSGWFSLGHLHGSATYPSACAPAGYAVRLPAVHAQHPMRTPPTPRRFKRHLVGNSTIPLPCELLRARCLLWSADAHDMPTLRAAAYVCATVARERVSAIVRALPSRPGASFRPRSSLQPGGCTMLPACARTCSGFSCSSPSTHERRATDARIVRARGVPAAMGPCRCRWCASDRTGDDGSTALLHAAGCSSSRICIQRSYDGQQRGLRAASLRRRRRG